jgi:hypothetical protein
MAVTRPQTQPGVVEQFATDLADAVGYAKEHRDETPKATSIYGGVDGGYTEEAGALINQVMSNMMDGHMAVPPA